jgi:flagellar motor switch/type III secretory pathway protein FliN
MPEAATQIAPAAQAEVDQAFTESSDDVRWKYVMGLPCRVSVEIPVPGFTPKELMKLGPKSIVLTRWATTTNPALKVNGELVAWCELEVLGNRLAIRLTELAI